MLPAIFHGFSVLSAIGMGVFFCAAIDADKHAPVLDKAFRVISFSAYAVGVVYTVTHGILRWGI